MHFVFEERPSDSSYVDKIWRTHSTHAGSFLSRAVSQWEMVVWRHQGTTQFTVRGPETHATPAHCPADAEFVGIQFKLGTCMPRLPTRNLVNAATTLPNATSTSFWLHGSAWELPTFENADVFVNRLIRQGILMRDPVVAAAMEGHTPDISIRSLQYRFLQATGLTYKTIQQIERARSAVSLLEQGIPIVDTAFELGYFDQHI